ncbi:helix-turn-helix domain-containing protein [uncultured Friedmanniella sp.]|uniref:helix-turn-helix domain-containing protein n=1 Tax=uncultured Friedmanniella sp. TaxID=335381 RepID=UPI0035CBC001
MVTTPPVEATVSLSTAVAAEVRSEIARRGIRPAAFADQLGVPVHWLRNRLNGLVQINLDDLAKIAEGLDVDPTALLERAAS